MEFSFQNIEELRNANAICGQIQAMSRAQS